MAEIFYTNHNSYHLFLCKAFIISMLTCLLYNYAFSRLCIFLQKAAVGKPGRLAWLSQQINCDRDAFAFHNSFF